MDDEYYDLVDVLKGKSTSTNFENQFFKHLVITIKDTNASGSELLLAYLGALSTLNEENITLPFHYDGNIDRVVQRLSDFNLKLSPLKDSISLLRNLDMEVHPYITEGFQLKNLRNVREFEADIALKRKLKDDNITHYRSAGQRDAIRLSLTSERDNTIIANIPTGIGKTLIAHSLMAFEQPQNLTVLVVPTVALAIEQATRVSELFDQMGINHSGAFAWYGTLNETAKIKIKERLKQGTQRVIVAAPESICRSLLPILTEIASSNRLANFIIDEAHILDSWGAGFRPEFQLLSAVLEHLRNLSKDGIKCLLMSATLTQSTIDLLKSFFEVNNKPVIEINGSFLRPELCYEVQKCNNEETFTKKLLKAVIELPKPQIIYAVTQEKAEQIYSKLKKEFELNRIGLFTGNTDTNQRESLIKEWNEEKLDIMVATSAFGVGMNRSNIRTIIHAQIPENIDRYYQEVGRAGRDGKNALSLLLYQEMDKEIASRINDEKIITLEVGFDRWQTLWKHRKNNVNGIELDLQVFRRKLKGKSKSNVEWNIHTLLLMQRSGFLKLNFKEFNLPLWDDSIPEHEYQKNIKKHFEEYYSSILITDVDNQVFDFEKWKENIGNQRARENSYRKKGFLTLIELINEPSKICFGKVFQNTYISSGHSPEYVCSGCPQCARSSYKSTSSYLILGESNYIAGWSKLDEWSGNLKTLKKYQFVYFEKSSYRNIKKQTREWKAWLSYLLESGKIRKIVCSSEMAELIYESLPSGIDIFWTNDLIQSDLTSESLWPQLIILGEEGYIPGLGWDTLTLLIAPEEIESTESPYRKWWEIEHGAISLENFEASIKWQ